MRISNLATAAALLVAAVPFSAAHAQTANDAARAQAEVARLGGMTDGRWAAGSAAPDSRDAYRTPVRGTVMPRYCIAPSFYIRDWSTYGLPTPQVGNGWYRYYDVAVLVDREGRVLDYRRGIDWSGRTPRSYRTGTPLLRPAQTVSQRRYYNGTRPVILAGASPQPIAPGTAGGQATPVVLTPGTSYTTTTTSYGPEGGYVADGYYYPPHTVTTITIDPPITTTTDEVVTYTVEDAAE
ncbi:RcnB family protein [Sphingomonas silueang]|uniref:RcnB family protein n=1 Tax=Sphingomonas silueang TaxID=3156617 RepID=UPI0032B3A93A